MKKKMKIKKDMIILVNIKKVDILLHLIYGLEDIY